MSRSEPFVVVLAGIAVSACAWFFSSQDTPVRTSRAADRPQASQPERGRDVASPEFLKTLHADGLFDHAKWEHARRAYDAVLSEQTDWHSPVAIGETIEVELTISADKTYEYLAFEDPKPAGCEPVQLRSGYTWGGGLCSNVELRDERVVFFVGWLPKGEHLLSYKLRAESVGDFHALPATGFAMYAPEIHARSNETKLGIRD